MTTPHIHFIGCGKLGKTLAALIKTKHAGIISGIVNFAHDNAIQATQFIGQGMTYQSIQDLPPADIYFITTPDDAIQKVGEALVQNNPHSHGKILVHCSGALSSDILSAAKQYHCSIASIHPIKSCAHPAESIKTFAGTYCAIEGDPAAVDNITALFEKLGATVLHINKAQKTLYHAASVLANNYLVTLHYHALQCYQAAGIEAETAKNLVSALMTDALHNLTKLGHKQALTGPLQRGDTQTIANHLHALTEYPIIKELYLALGQATLPLTQHSPSQLTELTRILRTPLK